MSLFSTLFGPDINELVAQARQAPHGVLVDVRTAEEYREGHIESARNIPLASLGTAIRRQVRDTATPLFVYCLSGARSAQAVRELRRLGYEQVTDLGGVNRWSGPLAR